MNKTTPAALAGLLALMLSGCLPSKSFFGYTLHGTSLDGDYNCTFINTQATFHGEAFHEPIYLNVAHYGVHAQHRMHHPGESNTGGELSITLDCFNDSEQLLGTSTYQGTLINATIPSDIHVHNFMPESINPRECVEPTSFTGGPEFCVTMRGFTHIPPPDV